MRKAHAYHPWGIAPLECRSLLSAQILAAPLPSVTARAVDQARAEIDRLFGRLESQVAAARAKLVAGTISRAQFSQSTAKLFSAYKGQITDQAGKLPFGRKQLAPTLNGYLTDIFNFAKSGNTVPIQFLHESAVESIDDYIDRGLAQGRFTVSGRTPNVAGTWQVAQEDRFSQSFYQGTLRIRQHGSHVSGGMDWQNFPDGRVEGEISKHGTVYVIEFRITYSQGGEPYGDYTAIISEEGRRFDGAAKSASGNSSVWSATLNT